MTRFALTRTDIVQGFLFHVLLVVMADAQPAVDLVQQGRAQVGELARRDERIGAQPVVVEELGQVQTLGEEEREMWKVHFAILTIKHNAPKTETIGRSCPALSFSNLIKQD